MIFVFNTSSCHYYHLCHIIYKSQHRWTSYAQTRTGFTEIYAQSLSADWYIDLWCNDTVLVHDTLFCHDDHLYQLIFKSHHAWPSYGSDMNKLNWSLCTMLKSGLWPRPITQQHGSCLWCIILSWWSFVRIYFFKNLTMHDKISGRTQTGFTEAYAQSLRVDCDLDL